MSLSFNKKISKSKSSESSKSPKSTQDWKKLARLLKLNRIKPVLRTGGAQIDLEKGFFVDGSGSITDKLRFASVYANLNSIDGGFFAKLFGQQGKHDDRNRFVSCVKDLLTKEFFGCASKPTGPPGNLRYPASRLNPQFNPRHYMTYPDSLRDSIKTFCKKVGSAGKNAVLTFICDGGFTGSSGKKGSVIFAELIADLSLAGDLKNVAGLVIFFPTGTDDASCKQVKQDMAGVIKTLAERFVFVEFVDPPLASDGTALSRALAKLPSSVTVIPEGFEGIGSLD
jgi:hypothetical protein